MVINRMNRNPYVTPETAVVEYKIESNILSGVNAARGGYGTASEQDGTEQTWD